MVHKNIVLSVLIALVTHVSQVMTIDFNRPLINYVIEQEKQLSKITDDYAQAIKSHQNLEKIHTLWHNLDNSEESAKVKSLKFETNLKIHKLETSYNKILKETLARITKMVETDGKDQLALKDSAGNTVLNYCKTKQIYEKLRELGAPFQLDMATHFIDTSYMNFSTIWGSILFIDSLAFLLLSNKDNYWKNVAYMYSSMSGLNNLIHGAGQTIMENQYKIPYKS